MSYRATWLAWSLACLTLAMFVSSVALSVHAPSDWSAGGAAQNALYLASFSPLPVVGALIASKRPWNPIGWICLADGLVWGLIGLSEEYGTYGLVVPGSLPFPVRVYALAAWMWVPAVGLLGTYLLLLFPDGKLPSRRWRPLAWLSGAEIVVLSAVVFLTPGPLDTLGGARNPFGLEGQHWITVAAYVVLPLLPLCMVASAMSLVVRYRRSTGEEREQIKWIAFAASFMGLFYLGIMVGALVFPEDWGLGFLEGVMLLSFGGIPVAIGFAVLRYRLYDIDVIINRTLVYGALTGALALVYFGGVTVTQALFRNITGQEQLPQLVVVVSTLLIAALFTPLRRRIQSFIDRRFYRSKYDARKTLEAFSSKLRDETDLEALNDELVWVVRETMQPAHASLWLRPETGMKSDKGQRRPTPISPR